MHSVSKEGSGWERCSVKVYETHCVYQKAAIWIVTSGLACHATTVLRAGNTSVLECLTCRMGMYRLKCSVKGHESVT
jgi:hypothetical protein